MPRFRVQLALAIITIALGLYTIFFELERQDGNILLGVVIICIGATNLTLSVRSRLRELHADQIRGKE